MTINITDTMQSSIPMTIDEEYQYYKRFYKQLHAVLANVKLREKVFKM